MSRQERRFQRLVERLKGRPLKALETRRCSISDSDDSDNDDNIETLAAASTAATSVDNPKKVNRDLKNSEIHACAEIVHLKASSSEALFKVYAARAFDRLFMHMQLVCRMEAEEHLQEARWFDNACFYIELSAQLLGVASLSGVATFIANWIPGGQTATDSPSSRLGIVGTAGIAVAGVLQYVGKGSAKILPSFKKRCDQHRQASATWMELKQDVKLVRIKLRDPDFSVQDVERCYRNAVTRRRQLSESILVSLKTADWVHDELMPEIKRSELGFLRSWPIAVGKAAVSQGSGGGCGDGCESGVGVEDGEKKRFSLSDSLHSEDSRSTSYQNWEHYTGK